MSYKIPRAGNLLFGSIVALVAAVSVAAVLQACGADIHAADTEPYLHTAATQRVHLQDSYVLEREFAGEVRAGQTSELGFELAGQVTELLVDEGDVIHRGQVLARLDTDLLVSRRDELSAQLAELRAEYETTKLDLDRIEGLRARQLASEREYANLAGRVRVLEASLDRVRATLEANQIRIRKSELRAPFDSRIAIRHVDSGVVVEAGIAVFSLVESGVREVRAGVPVSVAETLQPGDEVSLRSGDDVAIGHVIQIGAVVNQATRSRSLRVAISEDWTPGKIAYVVIGVEMKMSGAWVPDSAVTEGMRGTWVAYAAVPDGDNRATLEARSVVIHHASGGRFYVSGALADGEQVLAGGLHRFAPGQKVRPENYPVIADAHQGT